MYRVTVSQNLLLTFDNDINNANVNGITSHIIYEAQNRNRYLRNGQRELYPLDVLLVYWMPVSFGVILNSSNALGRGAPISLAKESNLPPATLSCCEPVMLYRPTCATLAPTPDFTEAFEGMAPATESVADLNDGWRGSAWFVVGPEDAGLWGIVRLRSALGRTSSEVWFAVTLRELYPPAATANKTLYGETANLLVLISDAVLTEISLRSPRKLFIFIIKKYIYRIKVSKNKNN